MRRALLSKTLFMTVAVLMLLVCAVERSWAEKGALGDESWYVKPRIGRYFYITHGAAVWGHEFGFFKDPSNCAVDTLFLTFSSSDERVKGFEGKDVVISITIDGKAFNVRTPMLSVEAIGITQVMMFTNWQADNAMIAAIAKGKRANVTITEPKELAALLDIKDDEFALDGFKDSRAQAMDACSQEFRGRSPEGDIAHGHGQVFNNVL